MKRNLVLLLVAVLVLSLALIGCAPRELAQVEEPEPVAEPVEAEEPEQPEPVEEPEVEEPVELRIAWWGSQARHDRTNAVIEMFTAKYPHITFLPEFAGWAGYWERMAAQLAANELPDIIQQDYQFLRHYAQEGLLLNLNPFIGDLIDLTNIEDGSVEGGRVDGNLYGVNLGNNALTVIYDPALFAKAGISEPQPGWLWGDFVSMTKALSENLGIYGAGSFAGGTYHGFSHFLRQRGYTFYHPTEARLGYENDQYFAEFFQKEIELVAAGVLPTPDVRLEIVGIENELMVTERAAMVAAVHSNQIVALASAAGRPLEMVILPKDVNQIVDGQYIKPSQFFSVTSNTKNPEEAVMFVNFFVNDIEANKVLLAERGVPISSAVREALLPVVGDAQKQMFAYIEMIVDHITPIDPPEPPGHTEIAVGAGSVLETLHQRMLFGEITAEEAAATFRREANAILERVAAN